MSPPVHPKATTKLRRGLTIARSACEVVANTAVRSTKQAVNLLVNLLVNLDVDDLDRAVHFYSAAFGLTVGRRFGTAGVEMLGSASPLYLLQKAPGTPAADTTLQCRDYGRHWTPLHPDFVVQDIESAIQRAVAVGARLETPVTIRKWDKLAPMADPFGHGLSFVQFLGQGYDEIGGC